MYFLECFTYCIYWTLWSVTTSYCIWELMLYCFTVPTWNKVFLLLLILFYDVTEEYITTLTTAQQPPHFCALTNWIKAFVENIIKLQLLFIVLMPIESVDRNIPRKWINGGMVSHTYSVPKMIFCALSVDHLEFGVLYAKGVFVFIYKKWWMQLANIRRSPDV